MKKRLVAAAVLGCVSFAGPTSIAEADTGPSCGDKISANIVLTKNLDCTGTALYVASTQDQSITVNLNGHRIRGNGTGTGIDTAKYSPFPDRGTRTLIVADGTITGFASALIGPDTNGVGAKNVLVTNVRFASNGTWLPRRASGEARIEDSKIIDSGQGGAYTDSAKLVVEDTTFVRSGILSASESYNTLNDNTFVGGGFTSYHVSTLAARRNVFRDCDTGILMGDIWIAPTQIEANVFRDCRIGAGLYGISGPLAVQGNMFVGNTEAGLVYQNPGAHLVIEQNAFLRNNGDGLRGTGPGAAGVNGNRAVGNAGLGINVPEGTLGANNIARGNGNVQQCVGVTCTFR